MSHPTLSEVYKQVDDGRPGHLETGVSIWTHLESSRRDGAIRCKNSSKGDNRPLFIRFGRHPNQIRGMEILTDDGELNPELHLIPVFVRVEWYDDDGYFEGILIGGYEEDSDEEGSEYTVEGPNRDEAIEWEGNSQKSDPEKVRRRNEVFKEEDIRGSKNDLLK